MSNTSATGGPLLPIPAGPEPLTSRALRRFMQQLVVGVTGLSGEMVRPRYQTEPPNIPQAGNAWCALGLNRRGQTGFPYRRHVSEGDGYDVQERHEDLEVPCSFYDTGADGLADTYAELLVDGLYVPQNHEILQLNEMGFVGVTDPVEVPSLLKERWLYRIDVTFTIRRRVVRTYPVLNLLKAQVWLRSQNPGSTEVTSQDILVEQ